MPVYKKISLVKLEPHLVFLVDLVSQIEMLRGLKSRWNKTKACLKRVNSVAKREIIISSVVV